MIPQNDRLILKLLEKKEEKKGVLVLLENHNKQDVFEILAVCEGEINFQPGEDVILEKYAAQEVFIDDERFFTCDKKQVLMKLK